MIPGISASQLLAGAGASEPGGGETVVVTWNPADKDASITLTNSDLTATATATDTYAVVRATLGHSTSKRYYEVRAGATPDDINLAVIGVATSETDLADYLGSADGFSFSAGYYANGDLYSGGSFADSFGVIDEDEWVGLAIDLDAGKGWVRDGDGWNGDPEAGTDPSFTFSTNIELFAAASLYSLDDTVTANFGASSFAYAVPDGFDAWNVESEPAPAPGATFEDVVFLSGWEGTDGATAATDDSNAAHSITFVGTAQLDTGIKQFDLSSLQLDGSGYCTVPTSSDFLFGSGAFVIEFFLRLGTFSQSKTIVAVLNPDGAFSWQLRHVADGGSKFRFSYSTDGSGLTQAFNLSTSFSTSAFQHYAIERDEGGILRVYNEGELIHSMSLPDTFYAASEPLSIGADANGNGKLEARIDELRITKGASWYRSSVGLIVPAAPYPRS